MRNGWSESRLRFLAVVNPPRSEVNRLPPDTEVSFVPMDAVGEWGGLQLEETRPVSAVYGGYTYFRDRDVVVAKITPCFENGKGAQADGLANGVAFGTTELHVLRPGPALDGRFLFYLTSSSQFRNAGTAAMTGAAGQKRVPEDFIRDFRFSLPPRAQQRAIANFLDERTAAIDVLISKKERLIELVQERRQATITKVVTKGLNPDASTKDSGVAWLGSIPSNWRVVRLKHLAVSPFMYGANEAAELDDPDLPRYIRITDLNVDGTLREETFRSLPEEVARPYMLHDGDILFARSGATVGKAVRYRATWGPACFAGYLIRMRPDTNQILPEYLEFYTQSGPYQQEVELSTVQATIQNVGAQRYGEFRVPVPDLQDQERIIGRLADVDRRTRHLTAKLNRQIAKLWEWRQTVVSAAVSGQIDAWARDLEEVPA